MKNKKLITLLVCLAMSMATVGAFSACGDTPATPESTESSSNVESTEESSSESESDSSPEVPETVEYTVTFKSENGEESTTQTVEEGKMVTKPEDPSKEYYVFDGWYNGETKWHFSTDKVSADITLTAKWVAKEYVVRFEREDGTLIEEKTYTVENKADFTLPAVPEEGTYAANGSWNKTAEDCITYSEEPVVVVAQYERIQRNVTFVNETAEVKSITVGDHLKITDIPTVTRNYYNFDGWYNGETKWDFENDVVTGDVTLTAKWVAKEYVVRFVKEDNTLIEEKTYTVENAAEFTLPAVPVEGEYAANGSWNKTKEECLTYSEEPVIVVAEYERIPRNVTFVNETAEVKSITVGDHLKITDIPTVTKEYYNFDGWYNGETKWDFENDVVTGDVTLTAKWTAKTYTVQFVDFSGNTTELTYTCENADSFALPAVPAAPEHYENADWDKNVSECIVYSEETIVVNATATPKTYLVTFENADVENQGVTYNETVVNVVPAREGYAFKGWLLDNQAYDFNTPVTGDITLVATWYKKLDSSVDSVISAQYVRDNVQLESHCYKEEEVTANPNASWYFDSDYNASNADTGSATGTVENQFANWIKFTLTYDGGAGTSDTGRETYLVLPAINYKLYSKVDFAYLNSSNIKALTIYGTEVAQFGGNNKLISIVTDENGTKLYFREINSVKGDVTVGADAVIDLPESVANGSEGLTLNITVSGWFKFAITEFHAKKNTIDYGNRMQEILAQLPEKAEDLTGSAEESALIAEYLTCEKYLTDYERQNYTTPDVILVAADNSLFDAVNTAVAGSEEQAKAIEEYRAYHNGLTAEQKASATHQANVAAINAIINENFYEEKEEVLLNDPTVDTSKGAVDQNERIQTGWGGHNTDYNTTYETYVHMIQFTSGDYDSTVTLPAMNYNACIEAYFGLRAITADGTGTITIGDGSKSFDNTKNHNWKVTIVGNILTVSDDNKSNNDGGGVLWTTVLSDDVANGTTGLVIDCNFEAWTQVEITEMHVLKVVPKYFSTVEDNAVTMEMSGTTVGSGLHYDVSTYWDNGCHTAFNTSYTSQNLVSFNAADSAYTATFTLPKHNFAKYAEAYFGFTAATAAGDATVTINGTSYTYDANAGYLYVKMLVKDGVLTVIGDGANNNGTVYMTTALPESVLNGTEALTITWSTAGWSQVEITEVQTNTETVVLA